MLSNFCLQDDFCQVQPTAGQEFTPQTHLPLTPAYSITQLPSWTSENICIFPKAVIHDPISPAAAAQKWHAAKKKQRGKSKR